MDTSNDEPVRYQQQSRIMRLQLSLSHLEHLGILQGLDKESDFRKGIKLLHAVIAKEAAKGEK